MKRFFSSSSWAPLLMGILLGVALLLIFAFVSHASERTGAQMKKTKNSDSTTAFQALSEEEWRERLTPEEYRILREKGTERAFSGAYWDTKTPGVYRCTGCGQILFSSDAKYDSGCGWPSFTQPVNESAVGTAEDSSFFMVRTEIYCSRCGGHLGHVFEDGPLPTGLRYCVNSTALELDPDGGRPGK